MKNTLEVFFDYSCPYCLRGHEYLKELITDYPELEVVWRPCEAHPRPEEYGRHSDLCIKVLLYALDAGEDVWFLHGVLYNAALKDRVDIENPEILAGYAGDVVDKKKVLKALLDEAYSKRVEEGNDYAYGQNGVWALPSYRMNGKKLDSVEGVGITKSQLRSFIDMSV